MSKHRFPLNGDGTNPAPKPDDRDRNVVTELSKRYKELSALWDKAEERLLKYRVPVDVSYCYKSYLANESATGDAQVHSYLGFVKYGRGWRICHCQNHDERPEHDWAWKPVVDSTLDVRVEAFQHLDALREKVIKAAEECVPKLDNALADFRQKLANW
jgi:hypothetical protein